MTTLGGELAVPAPRYRKKPVEIEAAQWPDQFGSIHIIDWIIENGGTARYHEEEDVTNDEGETVTIPEHIAIDTLEGTVRAELHDWIIRGVKGEFYPCKPDIFAVTYGDEITADGREEPTQLTQIRQWLAGELHPEHDTFAMGRGYAEALLAHIDSR